MKEFGKPEIQELGEKDLQPIESESDVIEDAEHKILSKDEMAALLKRHGFTEGSHGTFSDKEQTIFLYVKNKFKVTDQKELGEKLDILRTLTKQGILYPETRWGAFNDGEQLQIFAVTRALQQISPMDEIADAEGAFYNRKKIEGILGEGVSKEDSDNLLLTSPDSHITRWFRRVDPNYDPAEGPKGEHVRLLNWVEASHTDNWGLDIQSNTFYPIDVEVIDLPMDISQENSTHDI